MDILEHSILQGKLMGAILTLELLTDKIEKTNPKGEWLEILNDLKAITQTNKDTSNILHALVGANTITNKALKLDLGKNTSEVLRKCLKNDFLESENKRLKEELTKLL